MLNTEQIDFLHALVDTPTPSGSEAEGALLLGRRIREKTGIQPSIDVHGNLIAKLDTGSERTVMLEGHGDEIGFMVSYIDSDGFVYLQPIGGIVADLVPAERIAILSEKGKVNGVVGTRPPHLAKNDSKGAAAELKSLPCDIGASSKSEAESLVRVGDAAVADTGWRTLAGTRVSARGFDDRVGSFAMCEAFIALAHRESKPKVNVVYVSSVCEEIGLVGGNIAAYAINPDIGVSCDVGFATDARRDDAKAAGDIALGGGAALANGPIYHKGLRAHFAKTAAECDISIQNRPVPRGSSNNGWALKLAHGGAAVVQIAVPLRYMHSPVEVLDLRDVASVIDVTTAAVAALTPDFLLLPPQP